MGIKGGRENLAAWLSRCRIDAMAFDGLENLFFPVYDASPGAKVVILSWRTYKERQRSINHFTPTVVTQLIIQSYLHNAPHLLPWGALVIPALDMLSGGDLTKFLSSGHPNTFATGPAVRFWHNICFGRRVISHFKSPLSKSFNDEADFLGYFEDIRRYVPEKDRMEWNMKKNTPRDLCDFIGIKDHPGCEKPMPRITSAGEIFIFERNEPFGYLSLVAIYLTLHIVNYKLIYGVVGFLAGLMTSQRKEKAKDA